MFSRIILMLSLIMVQLFLVSNAEAQAFPGYSNWDAKVRDTVGCGINNTICVGNFVQGQSIKKINVNCFDSMCPTTVGTKYIGTDLSQIYPLYLSNYTQWTSSSTEPRLTFNTNPGNNTSQNFFITATMYLIGNTKIQDVYYSPTQVTCSLYVEGLGCADDDLDRTSMADGPCEICSKIGNPFDVRNGAKYEHAIDLDFPISVIRNYSSRKRIQGMFGTNWRSNFDKTLNIVKNNGIITSLIFTNPNGEYIILQGTDGTNFSALFHDQRQYKVTINNNQIKLVRPDSGFEIYDLATSRIISETFKGKTLTYQYNNYGLISKVTDQFGRYLQFSYSNYANVVEEIYASNGDDIIYSYDNGNVGTVKLNNINQITYQYSGFLLTGKLDGQGIQYASFSYDAQGRGIENKWITSDGHEIKKYSVSYNNNTTSVTQNNGFSRTYNMSGYEYAQKIKNMNGNGISEQVSMDSIGNVLSKTDSNGFVENYEYDNDGRIDTYHKDGKSIGINWNTDLNFASQIEETTANGAKTTNNFFDENGNDWGTQVIGTGGQKYVYKNRDTYGRLTSEEYDTGLVKTYTYYPVDISIIENGLLKSITSNTGEQVLINSYDTRGNPTSITTNGVTKTITYDYKGRILTETLNGGTNSYSYDANGNMLTAQMATGYQLTMTYDSANRLLSVADNMGGSSSFGIDDYTNEILNTSIFQNNALVRAKNKIIDSLGRTTQTWNATTRTKQYSNYASRATVPDSTTDANGIQSSYNWSSRGMIGYSSGNDNSSNGYDVDGNLTSVVVNNQTTTMSYDDFGRITTINSPDSGNKSYSYSQTQDVYTDAKGTVHTLNKGTGGLPVNFTHVNNDSSLNYSNYESYQYDSYGRVSQISSNSSETNYGRNNLGQLTNKTINMLISGNKALGLVYGYDNAGQKISETYPSGLVINYGYTNGFLTSISAGGTPIVSNINYNSMLKEPVSWNLGGNQVTMTKDTDGLLTGFIDSGIFNQIIGTDNQGHVTSLADSVSNNNLNVNLNSNYALSSGMINGKSLSYQYGLNNNVTSQQDGLTSFTFDYQNNNNKLSVLHDITTTPFNYSYDANGNLTANQHGNYQYDGKNRLEYYTDKNGNMVRYYYDGLNQRIAKWVQGGQLKYFVYNENKQLIGEYDSSGNVIAEYVYFGLRPVAVKQGSNINIVHTDYLGTPRVVTSGGSVVWQWKNDNPYGNNMAQGTIEFNLRFTGQYYDPESGLNYNINRTYDPESGRYLQSDPIGLAGGFNTYNYAERNPLSAIDPDGHMPLLIPVIGAVAGGLSNGLNYYSQGKNPWTGAIIGAGVGAAAAYTEPALAASAIGRAAMRYVSADAIAGAIGGAGTQLLNRIAGVNLIDTGHPAQDCILETVMSAGVGGIFGGIFSSLADGSAMSSANAFIRTYSDEFKAGFVSAYSTSYTNLVNAYANLAGVLR